jgi:hypothetical protein
MSQVILGLVPTIPVEAAEGGQEVAEIIQQGFSGQARE